MTLKDLKNIHKDKTCNIIGCGTSVKNINKYNFGTNDIIIALYHTIHLIERLELNIPVYSLQKDGGIKYSIYEDRFNAKCPDCSLCWERMTTPKNALLLSTFDCLPHYDNRIIFNILELKSENTFSGETAILLSDLMGCNHINMIGFDSHFNKYDTLIIDKEMNIIEKTYDISKSYYMDSNNKISEILKNKSHNWIYLEG